MITEETVKLARKLMLAKQALDGHERVTPLVLITTIDADEVKTVVASKPWSCSRSDDDKTIEESLAHIAERVRHQRDWNRTYEANCTAAIRILGDE